MSQSCVFSNENRLSAPRLGSHLTSQAWLIITWKWHICTNTASISMLGWTWTWHVFLRSKWCIKFIKSFIKFDGDGDDWWLTLFLTTGDGAQMPHTGILCGFWHRLLGCTWQIPPWPSIQIAASEVLCIFSTRQAGSLASCQAAAATTSMIFSWKKASSLNRRHCRHLQLEAGDHVHG